MRDNHGSGLLVGRYVNYLSPPALWSSSLWGEKSLIPTWQRDRLDMFFALPQIVPNTIESFLMWSWTMAVITHSSSGQPWRLCQSFQNGWWCPSLCGLAGYIKAMNVFCTSVDLICDFKCKNVVSWSFWPRGDSLFPWKSHGIITSPKRKRKEKKKLINFVLFGYFFFFLHLATLVVFPVKNNWPAKITYTFFIMLCYCRIFYILREYCPNDKHL